MNIDEMIRAAQDALGAGSTEDDRIQPGRHANELAARAPALTAILRKSAVSAIAEEYERKDRQANESQAIFKATAKKANWSVLLTACFSTLLLVVGPLKSVAGVPDKIALAFLGVCGVVTGGLGTMWVYRAREGRLLDAWMSARAAAEALRTQYFETVTSLEVPGDNSPIAPELLQFEYFRRYQLDVQIDFYARRAESHRRDADRLLRISALAVALASVSAGAAAVLSTLHTAWVSIAALGAIATAVASFAATQESINQNRRTAETYENTCDALSLLKRKLDDVRAAAAAGEVEAVKQFVATAHEQIAAEHRQWLAAAQSIQPAIDKLDDTLSKLKPKLKEPPAAARTLTQASG